MSAPLRLALFLLFTSALATLAFAQQSDPQMMARVLGPKWRHITRASGMVFSGEVLQVKNIPATGKQALPVIEMKFRVEHAIAGTHTGQVLTLREWAGAWTTHQPIKTGQHMLMFFYKPSWLGLTSPVGGHQGVVALSATGQVVVPRPPRLLGTPAPTPLPPNRRVAKPLPRQIGIRQMATAIRGAREE